MFIGQYQNNLDAKRRIVVPAKFREELGDTFYLAHGFDGGLAIYSEKRFKEVLTQFSKLPLTQEKARKFLRVLTTKSVECTPDKMGRINIPDHLANDAGLQKECVIVGVYDRVEIWDKNTWENYYDEASENFEEIAEGLQKLPSEDDE